MFLRVAIPIPSDRTFLYAVPEALEGDIAIGKRVLVPLGKKMRTGYILEKTSGVPGIDTKDIIEILDTEPLLHEEDLRFYRWVADYYFYPLGKMLGEVLPAGGERKSEQWIMLAPVEDRCELTGREDTLSPLQRKIVDLLVRSPKGILVNMLYRTLGKKEIRAELRLLRERKVVLFEDRLPGPRLTPRRERFVNLCDGWPAEVKTTEKQLLIIRFLDQYGEVPISTLRKTFGDCSALVKRLLKKGMITLSEREVHRRPGPAPVLGAPGGSFVLNDAQRNALRKILKDVAAQRFAPVVLHGVTGSGKTEVYLRAIGESLRRGGGVIVLVPEIALTPQLLYRFQERFGDREIAVLHSGIAKGVRYDQWRRIAGGHIRIVLGARSALFAPVRDLKLIIVDEEHDGSYKQDDHMRYHARDLALVKAKLAGAAVVLGSATPGIQTYFNVRRRKYRYLTMTERVEKRPLPAIEVIDMRGEKGRGGQGPVPVLSGALSEAIGQTLTAGNQALLFLNRRGFHTFMHCADCGHVFKCLNCDLSLTYHREERSLKCHYCDFSVLTPGSCPQCRSRHIASYGVGTERLEAEVKRLFPEARIARMDSDTTAAAGAYERILRALDRREIDILVGTQMITKGHDFPGITLVGVISADMALNLPDFRAAERTFQIITQVSGRGGRGDLPGRVFIQTFNPEHYAIRCAKAQDYGKFYDQELPLRRALSYPPFSRIVNLVISSLHREEGQASVERLGKIARDLAGGDRGVLAAEVVGPAEAPLSRIKGRYRWQLLLKGRDARVLHDLVREVLVRTAGEPIDIKIDVDPVNFM
jgi:primosomal protein N' (replication factor Y)